MAKNPGDRVVATLLAMKEVEKKRRFAEQHPFNAREPHPFGRGPRPWRESIVLFQRVFDD